MTFQAKDIGEITASDVERIAGDIAHFVRTAPDRDTAVIVLSISIVRAFSLKPENVPGSAAGLASVLNMIADRTPMNWVAEKGVPQ